MTGTESIRDWLRRAIEGRGEVEIRALAEECERAGVVDTEFRRGAVIDHLIIVARQVLGEVDDEGVRRWINLTVVGANGDGSRQVYKQEGLFDARDYRDAAKAYQVRIERLIIRHNALAQRAKEKAGVEVGQLRLAVARPKKATAS